MYFLRGRPSSCLPRDRGACFSRVWQACVREEGLERAGRASSPRGAVQRAQPGGGSSSVPAGLWLCHLLKLRWPAPQELTRSAPACPPDQPRSPNWAYRGDTWDPMKQSTLACGPAASSVTGRQGPGPRASTCHPFLGAAQPMVMTRVPSQLRPSLTSCVMRADMQELSLPISSP